LTCETGGADAIHPGYGFLAENADFAKACADAGITFIGPSPRAMKEMGLKNRGAEQDEKRSGSLSFLARKHIMDLKQALKAAKEIGYPVMMKASAGGGGRGLRICRSDAEIRRQMPLPVGGPEAFGKRQCLHRKIYRRAAPY